MPPIVRAAGGIKLEIGEVTDDIIVTRTDGRAECRSEYQICSASPFTAAQYRIHRVTVGGSVAEWLACWNQAHKGLGSNRSRDAVG